VLIDGLQAAGTHNVVFDETAGLASGLYLYRLQLPGQAITRTMLLVK
jgi:hypothetical protein